MTNANLGIKSLNERLANIEKVISDDVSVVGGFVGNTISNIKTKQYDKLISNIALFVDEFKKNIPSNIDAFNDIVAICSYAIKYIEANIKTFSTIVNQTVDSKFKLNTCLELIKEITNEFDETFLITTINNLVKILFPKTEIKTIENKPLQRTESLSKKTGKKLTCFMRHEKK